MPPKPRPVVHDGEQHMVYKRLGRALGLRGAGTTPYLPITIRNHRWPGYGEGLCHGYASTQ